MAKTIAIDFDGTITEYSPYPIMGKIREAAKKYIKLLHSKGYKLVLWTARTGVYLHECLNALEDAELITYFELPYLASGKISADFYIDDRSVTGRIKWKKIYKYIIKNIKEKK